MNSIVVIVLLLIAMGGLAIVIRIVSRAFDRGVARVTAKLDEKIGSSEHPDPPLNSGPPPPPGHRSRR